MEIWLTYNNSAETLRLPVLPSQFKLTTANGNTVVNVADFGELNLIGKTKLAELTLESFFPNQYYANLCEYSGFPDPYSCVNMIEKWRTSGKPIRVLLIQSAAKIVNMAATIESFTWGEQDGTGDVYYSLPLKEYRFASPSVVQSGLTITPQNYTIVGYYNPDIPSSRQTIRSITKSAPNSYTVKQDESIYTIAKRLTGNGANWYKISLINALISTTVAAGTVLKL